MANALSVMLVVACGVILILIVENTTIEHQLDWYRGVSCQESVH